MHPKSLPSGFRSWISWPSRKPLSSQLLPSVRTSVSVILLIWKLPYVCAARAALSVSVFSETSPIVNVPRFVRPSCEWMLIRVPTTKPSSTKLPVVRVSVCVPSVVRSPV